MTKATMKVFGVCAVTLMTVGMGTSLTSQAQEVNGTQGVESTYVNVTSTPNNLKTNADISITNLDAFATWVNENTVNTTAISNVSTSDSIAMSDVSSSFFNDLFLDGSNGKVAGNVGLSFDNESNADLSTLINQVFGGEGQIPNPDYDPDAPEKIPNPEYGPNNQDVPPLIDNPAYGQPEFIDGNGEAANGIYMTSNMGIDGNIYNVGDTVGLFFWTDYGIGNSNQLKKIKEVTVTFSGVGENADYQATATNLNKQVGQRYTPFENVSVVNNGTGEGLEPVVIVDRGGSWGKWYVNKQGVISPIEYTHGSFEADLKDPNSNLYTTIWNEFNYEPGDFYFISDTSDFSGGNRVKEEVIFVGTIMREVERTFNAPVSNFNQNLMIDVPFYSNTSGNQLSNETMYVSRLINVSDDGIVDPDPEVTAVPVYRVYNPNNGEHLFTTSQSEYNWLVGLGWTGENVAWQSPSEGVAVYRLYNPNSGEHFYTKSIAEYNNVGAAGWNKEGIAFYSADDEDGLPIYRSFNPNAKGAGSHMFTESLSEYNWLTSKGWSPEGIAFYALNTAN